MYSIKIRPVFLWLGVLLAGGRIWAATLTEPLVINSISAVDTNLVFVATFPSGVSTATLEMRPTLVDEWQPATQLNVPANGGMMEFTFPKPPLPTAFFRLNATMSATPDSQSNAQIKARVSSEVRFVIVPPLGPDSANTNEAVFHFKGMIDGADRIVIFREGAFWEHVNWDWPVGAVNVNGDQWNPAQKNCMTTTGAVHFLPEKYSLEKPRLELIQGRDVVALEQTNDALIVYLDDTPSGAAPYEFKIHFPVATRKSEPKRSSPAATLKIAAVIDGSDLLKITAKEATWINRAWHGPPTVKLNDFSWNLRQTNVWANAGTNRFLPAGVDLSTAKIVKRQGRDLATMWADDDAVWVNFADNPNGADAYELEISFGH